MCIADNFKMELCFWRYIFRHRQVGSTFLLGGLFILDFKRKTNKQINYNLVLTKGKAAYNSGFAQLGF
jgi:hypothetical protein